MHGTSVESIYDVNLGAQTALNCNQLASYMVVQLTCLGGCDGVQCITMVSQKYSLAEPEPIPPHTCNCATLVEYCTIVQALEKV